LHHVYKWNVYIVRYLTARRLHIVISLLFTLGTIGCAQREEEKSSNLGPVVFNVVDSLLAKTVTDSVLMISYRSPSGWKEIPSRILDSAMKTVDIRLNTASDITKLRSGYFDKSSGSILLFSRIDSFDVSDSSITMRNMAEYYRKTDSTASIQANVFLTGPFKVHQLLVTSKSRVIIKMVLNVADPAPPIFDMTFYIPMAFYTQKVKTVESVVGSIHTHNHSH